MLETCKYCMVMRYQYLTENIPLANHLVMLYSWVCHIKLLNSLLICSSIRMNSSINQSTSRKCVDLIRLNPCIIREHDHTVHHIIMCWRILTFMTPTHVVEAHFQLATPLSSHQHTIICAQYSLHAKNPPFHGPFSVRQAMFRYKDPHTGHPVSTWAACKKYFMFEYLAGSRV